MENNFWTYFKHVKPVRLLGVALTMIAALGMMWWLYDQEFHYANTDAGRLAAVEEYVPLEEDSSISDGVKPGTPLYVAAWELKENHLFLFYYADNDENAYGIVHLIRGLNGKYRILESDTDPSVYSGGLYGGNLEPRKTDWELFYFAGYNCERIARAEITFSATGRDGVVSTTSDCTLSGENFLKLIDNETLTTRLGWYGQDLHDIFIDRVEFFDENGENITAELTTAEGVNTWSSGKTTAEGMALYFYMWVIALLAFILVRYFLRRD